MPILKRAIWSGLVGFLVMEIGLRLLPSPKTPALFDVAPLPLVTKAPWYPQYLRDHDQLTRDFRAYEIYGLAPFSGRTIQIDAEGFRRGWQPPSSLNEVGVFGGSTSWGVHARDDYTLPSFLARELSLLEVPTQVHNFAEVGFVFSQEFHRSLRLLYGKSEFTSSHVIFVDGINDALAALTNFAKGVKSPSGLPWEFEKYRHLFALGKTGEVSWRDVARKSALVRRLEKFSQEKGWLARSSSKGVWEPANKAQQRSLAKQVAETYLRAVVVADQALRANGLEPVFVWQPILSRKKYPTAQERVLLSRNQEWMPYLELVYDNVESLSNRLENPVQFWNLAGLFENERETVFADVIHYNELGNQKIGKELSKKLLPRLRKVTKQKKGLS